MREKVGGQLYFGIFLDDRVFQQGSADMAGGAVLGCPAGTEEVEVFGAISAHGPLDDHPVDDAPFMAAVAVQRAFEVVVIDSASFTGHAAAVEEVLDFFKQLIGYEGLVTAGVFGAAEGDDADVVAVAKQSGEVR
ncbi:hypothetical protein [Arthrobacter sp. ERGS1:01]|uniref:hypothetical protein n=1 Tax=Arthrobacter sp. ERGS1:01 TaxID=1704044 RepID=UPI001ED99D44|nr:hypothetical protein [Arthrobacter sp. ERGS1:01]